MLERNPRSFKNYPKEFACSKAFGWNGKANQPNGMQTWRKEFWGPCLCRWCFCKLKPPSTLLIHQTTKMKLASSSGMVEVPVSPSWKERGAKSSAGSIGNPNLFTMAPTSSWPLLKRKQVTGGLTNSFWIYATGAFGWQICALAFGPAGLAGKKFAACWMICQRIQVKCQ